MLCVIMALTSCSKKIPHGVSDPIWIPDSVEHPKRYKYKNSKAGEYGIYDCDSDLFKCITYHDEAVLKINIKSLFEAHQSLVNLIKEHNRDQRIQQNIAPSEIKCKFFDFKCKKEKNKLEGQ